MSAYEEGTVQVLPIDQIKVGVNITNIRTVYSDEAIRELAESIYNQGLLVPVIVMEAEDAKGDEIWELVCGSRRLRAIAYIQTNIDQDWNYGEFDVRVFEGSLEEAELVNGVENIERAEVDAVDTAAWLYRLVETGYTQDDLAKKIHKSPAWVSARISFHRKASDGLKKAYREGLMSFTTACELAKNLNEEDQLKRIRKARLNNEKLIKFEDAKHAGDPDRVSRPSAKARADMQAYAESLAGDPKYGNAHGVAMALRWVDGTLSQEEIKTDVIEWIRTEKKDKDSSEDETE